MSSPASKREPEAYAIVLKELQKTRGRTFKIFTEEDNKYIKRRDIELIDLKEPAGRDRWRDLMNDPDIDCITEKDILGRSLVIVRFSRKELVQPDPPVVESEITRDLWPDPDGPG